MQHRVSKADADGGVLVEPGTYRAEVKDVREKTSRGGDAMLSLYFKDVDSGEGLCWDNVMLSGRGVGIGVKKMRALDGVTEEGDEYVFIDSGELIGRRCMLDVIHEEYDGKTRCVVDFAATDEARGVFFGYGPEVPGGAPKAKDAKAPVTPVDTTPEDDLPF